MFYVLLNVTTIYYITDHFKYFKNYTVFQKNTLFWDTLYVERSVVSKKSAKNCIVLSSFINILNISLAFKNIHNF